MQVTQLWRYPVKSLQGEQVDAIELGPQGLAGDRQWAIFDPANGLGLTARRVPELLLASARLREDGVEIVLPDGSVAAEDDALSAWLGRRVELRVTADVATRRYENPDDIETEAEESWAPFEGSDQAFHDGFTVTLLSAATVGDRPLRRFRPNIVVGGGEVDGGEDGGGEDGGGEDALVGATVRIGRAAMVEVAEQVPRCVMVTRPQPGGIDTDRDVLRWIHRERAGLLAVGGPVVRPGALRLGDEIAVVG